MAIVQIIGNKGSKSRMEISKGTGIKLYLGNGKPDVIVNYGLHGPKLAQFFSRYPAAKKFPILNRNVGCPKHITIHNVKKAGIPVPETRLTIPSISKISNWIEKRMQSSRGYGIRRASKREHIPDKYYQRMVKNRIYELRVHAFSWLPVEDWVLNKRIGPESQIAWNFHQGGHFKSISSSDKSEVFRKAKDISKKVLEIEGMAFGGVDFIVDKDKNIYFIEINSSPGFEKLNQGVYIEAFKKLKGLSVEKIKKYIQ